MLDPWALRRRCAARTSPWAWASRREPARSQTCPGPNNPTRCDRLLYANAADAPTDAACLARASEIGGQYSYDPEAGFGGTLGVGYAFGALSIELEFLERRQTVPGALFTLGELSGPAITGKQTELSAIRPPWGDISEFRGRQFFVNGSWLLPTRGRLTPYIGAGGGLSHVSFGSGIGFARKSVAEGYLEVFGGSRADPAASPDWQRAAAGTVSELGIDVSDTALTFQLLAGVDYALSGRVALGLKGRWVAVPDITVDAQ